jgi:hypothetical protein
MRFLGGGGDWKIERDGEWLAPSFGGGASLLQGAEQTGTESNGCGRCFSSSALHRLSSGDVTMARRLRGER